MRVGGFSFFFLKKGKAGLFVKRRGVVDDTTFDAVVAVVVIVEPTAMDALAAGVVGWPGAASIRVAATATCAVYRNDGHGRGILSLGPYLITNTTASTTASTTATTTATAA